MPRYFSDVCALTILLLSVLSNAGNNLLADPPPAPRDTPQGELHNVVARVIYPNDVRDLSRQAALEPGPFTIPKGYVATKFIYRWEDPKTDRKNDKLTATTIYSVTERRYLTEAKNNPNLILKAGEYKLVCGGLPEATGVLTYSLIREDLVERPHDLATTPKSQGSNIEMLVRVHLQGQTAQGDIIVPFDAYLPARLSIGNGRFALEFVLEQRSEFNERSLERWGGNIVIDNGVMFAKGTITLDQSFGDKWGGHGYTLGSGTFEGFLKDSTWQGELKVSGTSKATQVDEPKKFQYEAK